MMQQNLIMKYQKCGKQTFPANSSDTTVIQRASTKNIYEMPTW